MTLLYESVIQTELSSAFVARLSLYLQAEIESILLHNLVDGSVVTYAKHLDERLFVRQESVAGPVVIPGEQACQSGPNKELSFYPLVSQQGAVTHDHHCSDDCACSQLGIAWTRAPWLAQLVIKPKPLIVDIARFARSKAGLLSYLLPHLGAAYAIFLKQHERIARFNGLRTLQSVLPVPLLIRGRRDGSIRPNLRAQGCINSLQPMANPTSLSGNELAAQNSDRGWKLVREGSRIQLVSTTYGARLPPIRLHQLAVGNGGDNEVYLVGGSAFLAARLNDELLMRAFSLTAREAKLCTCAIQSKSPQAIAAAMNLSINTVKARLKPIYRALSVNSIAQLIVRLYFHPAYWAANYGQIAEPALVSSNRNDRHLSEDI